MNKSALIVDDDRTQRRLIISTLRNSMDFSFLEAENGRDALRILSNDRDHNINLVILDLDMPVMGGIDTLGSIRKLYPNIPVIILTGNTETDNAVKAIRIGAADFLSKPVENARLNVSVHNALKMSSMSQEISRLKIGTQGTLRFSDLIGYNAGLRKTVQLGQKAAACNLPVLITGETGTGKEMFSSAIHGESARAEKPFIAVNCGAIPEKLVESTLFGHEKGAFTGAIQKASGKFQEANGGTIFLDEIGELPLEAQVKLLRVLQQQEVEPVGAAKTIPIDVRVISATNRNLSEEVQEGRFREDLYFRLNVLHIDLPPLRTRPEDISTMSSHFIEQFCATHHTDAKNISKDAMHKLRHHTWPGNVRELENVINRTMALHDHNIVEPEHIAFIQAATDHISGRQKEGVIVPVRENGTFKSYKELEQEIVILALAHHDNNMSRTARVLGIAKSTLYTKLDHLVNQKRA